MSEWCSKPSFGVTLLPHNTNETVFQCCPSLPCMVTSGTVTAWSLIGQWAT